jgi:type I restriction enzyme S subunit
VSNGLPAGWQVSCLDELASSVGGGTPSKSEPKFWSGGNVPWVSPKDMKSDLIYDSEDHVTEAALDRLSVVPADSILVVVRSGILSRTLPVAQTKVPVTVNQDMRAFVPEGEICASYLAWQLRAKEREILGACSKDGTTVASIEGPALARFPLAVAPAGEQTRIVAKLEELLSDLDAGVAELKVAQKKLQQYRQSLLKAAVEGALTADWREAQRQQGTPTETGAQLLARILSERRARWEAKQLAKFKEQGKTPPKDWQKKYPEPARPQISDMPTLPEGWVWATIDQLTLEQRYGSSAKTTEDSSGVPVLRMGNLQDGRIDYASLKFLPKSHDEFPDLFLEEGDLLFNRTNSPELVGKTAVYRSERIPCSYASYLIAVRFTQHYVSEIAATYINSAYGRQWIKSVVVQQVGQANVNGSKLAALAVPVPPMAEQVALLRTLSMQAGSAVTQEQCIDRSLKFSAAQRQSILRAAFTGQLVPQDPKEETASVLLERIRAERVERAKQPKVRRAKQEKEIATMLNKLIDVLAEAEDWVPAQEAFRRCGVADGALTERIEELYAELRKLDKAGRLEVEAVTDERGRKLHDRIKLRTT